MTHPHVLGLQAYSTSLSYQTPALPPAWAQWKDVYCPWLMVEMLSGDAFLSGSLQSGCWSMDPTLSSIE